MASLVTTPSPIAPAPARPTLKVKLPKPISGDTGAQSGVVFLHPNPLVGSLTIGTGIDTAQWGYNLNTAVYPTYGGEVVQILSVYIDDLQIGGSVATYSQMEAIYSYFAAYMQIATQGRNPTPDAGNSAYNLQPISFSYPARGWEFEIMPMSVPGFYLAQDLVLPSWQLTAHVVDDSVNSNPTLSSIKAQISNTAISASLENFAKINDEISPDMKNPDTMPFMVFTGNDSGSLQNYSDYYNNAITNIYSGTDPSTVPGSAPAPATPSSTPSSSTQGTTGSTVPTSTKTSNNPRGVAIN